MALFDACLKPLTQRQILVFFLVAILLFVYPIIQADYPYGDDVPRGLSLGEDLWRSQGRLFMELFQTVVGFDAHLINVFPLPLLVVLPLMMLALASLARHYFTAPNLFDCLVVLPLLYCPLFLGNLSYQFDGPMMVTALGCVIYAITYHAPQAWMRVCASGVLLALAAGFYQITLHVFVGLCCIECVRLIIKGNGLWPVMRALTERVVQLLFGALLYYFSAYSFYSSWRGGLAQPDNGWVALITLRMTKVMDALSLLINDGNRWLFIGVSVIAGIGLLILLWAVWRTRRSLGERAGLTLLCLIAFFVMLVAVPGSILVIQDFALNSRSLMAFSCVLVLALYLARNALQAAHPALCVLLVMPLFCMLSFAYAYGRVLVAQKAFETSVIYSISYDLASRPPLRDIEDFYLIAPQDLQVWLPAAAASIKQMPALAFILDLRQVTLAERFPMAGITNVASGGHQQFIDAAQGNEPRIIVSNRFYDITVISRAGFIQLKIPEVSGQYKYRW